MSTSICRSCHNLLRQRLRAHLNNLQSLRRSASSTTKPSLSCYYDTTPPTITQLQAAEMFFLTHKPRKLWTATEWRKRNESPNTSGGLIPEVAFLGRSNVGKSSLLNALLISPGLNHVGPRPGKTTTMHAWALAPTDPKTGGAVKGMKGDMETKCAVLDMPGYGHASHDDWGEEILAYLRNRKQLKRAFVLVDGRHGLKTGDLTMLRLLRKQGVSVQVVASKFDALRVGEGEEVVKKLWSEIKAKVTGPGLEVLGEVLVVGSLGDGRSNDRVQYKDMKGVDEVQWAILRATGLDQYAVKQAFPNTESKIPPPARPESQSSIQLNFSSLPIETPAQSPAKNQPEVPFARLAKVRQHVPPTSIVPPQAPSTLTSTRKAMNTAVPISQLGFISSLLSETPSPSPTPNQDPNPDQISDTNTPTLPATPSIGRGMAELLTMTSSPSPVPHNRNIKTAYGLMTTVSRIGRTPRKKTVSQRGKMKEKRKKDLLQERVVEPPLLLQQQQPAVEAWTGFADLEAMVERTQTQTIATASGRKKPQVQLRQKEAQPWTGSAVGGMADLEAMMERTSSSPQGSSGKKKTNKRRRH